MLHSLSKKWLLTQLSHKVSAKATNAYWELCMEYVPNLKQMWHREGQVKDIPGFIRQRRKLHKEYCPTVEMEFGFRKKTDGSIHKVYTETSPLKQFQNNPDYTKLYEISTIKVNTQILQYK